MNQHRVDRFDHVNYLDNANGLKPAAAFLTSRAVDSVGSFRVEKIISVTVEIHRETNILLAMSPEMKGLYVHGRTAEELAARIPAAIRALLEAEGHNVDSIIPIEDSTDRESGFLPGNRRFQAAIAA